MKERNALMLTPSLQVIRLMVPIAFMAIVLLETAHSQVDSSRPELSITDLTPNTKGTDEGDSTLAFHLTLDRYDVVISDTSEFTDFRFYVRNDGDSTAVIERVEPSCGCVLATVQKSKVRKGHDGEIYVGIVTKRMDDSLTYAIDVYTTANREDPLRLTIRKAARGEILKADEKNRQSDQKPASK